jgi:hypothetical protein
VKLAAVLFAIVALLVVSFGRGQRDEPSGSASGAPARAAAPVHPAPPGGYALPRGAVRVRSGHGLRRALARPGSRPIVLAPGEYTGARPFLNPNGRALYAARQGRALLRAGLSMGGNSGRGGGLVRGVVIDVADRARTIDGAAVEVWGVGADTQILDTTIRGHSKLQSGIEARRPDGLRIRRVEVSGFTDFGVLADANTPGQAGPHKPFSIRDLSVSHVSRPVPRSSDGRAEACLWVGATGAVRDVRLRDCAWAGLWTGSATRDATFDGIDVDGARTGIYIEHFTTDSRFRRVRVGSDTRIGLQAEWAAPRWDGRPASVGNVIEASSFASRLAGVYLDEGTTRTTVRASTFTGQQWAAIGDFRGTGNTFSGNDYRGIASGAERVSRRHLSSTREG